MVADQWRTEALLRALDDPEPMPVRWHLTTRTEVMDHPANVSAPALAGTSELIFTLFTTALALGAGIGAVLGILIALLTGLIGWIETPAATGNASTPQSNWRADRNLIVVRIAAISTGPGS